MAFEDRVFEVNGSVGQRRYGRGMENGKITELVLRRRYGLSKHEIDRLVFQGVLFEAAKGVVTEGSAPISLVAPNPAPVLRRKGGR